MDSYSFLNPNQAWVYSWRESESKLSLLSWPDLPGIILLLSFWLLFPMRRDLPEHRELHNSTDFEVPHWVTVLYYTNCWTFRFKIIPASFLLSWEVVPRRKIKNSLNVIQKPTAGSMQSRKIAGAIRAIVSLKGLSIEGAWLVH